MEKLLALILAILMVLGTFAACTSEEPKDTEKQTEKGTDKNGETVKPETDKNGGNSETEKKPSEGLEFELSEDGKSYSVKGIGTCTDKEVIIPDAYEGLPVMSIGDKAFKDCDEITSVIISDGVKRIGVHAFGPCWQLKRVTIGNNVESIGDYAFWACYNLTSIMIPNSVTSIGEGAFSDCSKLVEVINKSPLNIEKGSYSNGNVAYYALEIHNGESKIVNKNGYLFYTCGGVNYLVAYVGTDTELTLPANYNGENYVINKYAFYNNDNIISVIIPDSVTSIGDYAFYGCEGLTSVTIGDSVTSIGDEAFTYCTSLTSVTIPGSVTSIDGNVFSSCERLISINVDETNVAYKDIDGNLYNKDGTTLIAYAAGKADKCFIIPDSVTSIGDCAFVFCTNLMSVTIPNSVTSMDVRAIYRCNRLVEIINKSSLNIPKYASNVIIYYDALEVHSGDSKMVNKDGYLFYTCNGVNYLVNYIGADTELTLPANYNAENYVINDRAFLNNDNITSVIIPNSVISIDDYAFSGCSKLTSVEFKNPNGWWYASSADATSGTSISSTDLANTSTAATYLKSTYNNKYWKRS